jgi:hypothetical protein
MPNARAPIIFHATRTAGCESNQRTIPLTIPGMNAHRQPVLSTPTLILSESSRRHVDPPFPGRLIVKLRRILSPQAELSRTSKTFSAALPRLLLWLDPSPASALSSAPSKLNAEFVGRWGDNCGDTRGDSDIPVIEASVPRLALNAPSKPWVIKELRVLAASGESSSETLARAACFELSCSSSTKTSGPSCGTSVMRPDLFLSICCLNFLDQYLEIV